jgi:hypothetical protein
MEAEIRTRSGDDQMKWGSNEVSTVRKRGFVSFAFDNDEYTM